MTYTKVYVIIVIAIVVIISGTIGAGYYIDKMQEEQFAKLEPRIAESNTNDDKNKLALIARLKSKIVKLDEMAAKDPNKIAIIDIQRREIELHINAVEKSRQ